jgi:hypothetical protein
MKEGHEISGSKLSGLIVGQHYRRNSSCPKNKLGRPIGLFNSFLEKAVYNTPPPPK